jgi:FlaA1/EpsC-like NDP-sugar epimerase
VVCHLIALSGFRTYQGIWRYTGLDDLIRLGKALTLGSMAAVFLVVYFYRFEGFSRAVFILNWMLTILFIGASRVSFRVVGELLRPRSPEHKRRRWRRSDSARDAQQSRSRT